MSDIIDFASAKQDKSIKEIEDYLLEKLVFEHSDQLFPGFKENFQNEHKNSDSATKISVAIGEFRDRIKGFDENLAERYYLETLQVLVEFYQKLKTELGGDDEDYTKSITERSDTDGSDTDLVTD